MHTEVHVHGTVAVKNGVTQPELENALSGAAMDSSNATRSAGNRAVI